MINPRIITFTASVKNTYKNIWFFIFIILLLNNAATSAMINIKTKYKSIYGLTALPYVLYKISPNKFFIISSINQKKAKKASAQISNWVIMLVITNNSFFKHTTSCPLLDNMIPCKAKEANCKAIDFFRQIFCKGVTEKMHSIFSKNVYFL